MKARLVYLGWKLLVIVIAVLVWWYLSRDSAAADASAPAQVTYTGQVARILNHNCVVCHRPGGAGPFSLLTYEEAKRRATLIAAVTQARYMPPWQPAPQAAAFAGERRLSDEEIRLLARWAQTGAPRGDAADAPAVPEFKSGWQLGEPDLVVQLDQPFVLRAEGSDEFRNFVLPLPVASPRYVKAVEFRPGNPRVVHHAVMQVDRSHDARRRDAADEGPGFGGMDTGDAENPGGQFIGWTPGKVPSADERLAWRLEPGTDLVLQLHMLPTGKLEQVSPSIGVYFSKRPPSLHPTSLVLRNDDIDIAPGVADYVIEDSVVVPVPVQVIGVYPHAHYLGKSIEVWAELPGQSEKTWLVHIPNWDFNWQDDYRYVSPLELPAGSHIRMRYTYDNSAANVRNPSQPPARVRFGNRSTDEMGTLTLQVLPGSETDRWLLAEASARTRLARRPDSWFLNNLLGTALNQLDRYDEAASYFERAVEAAPANPGPLFNLANTHLHRAQYERAAQLYRATIALDPAHPRARNNFAIAMQALGDLNAAANLLEEQLRLNPQDARVHYNLGVTRLGLGEPDLAIGPLERAVRLDPASLQAAEDLGEALRQAGHNGRSRRQFQAVLARHPQSRIARYGMALLDVDAGERQRGERALRSLFSESLDRLGPLNNEAWRRATGGVFAQAAAALVMARIAVESYPEEAPELLDTLAAALAATGRYDEAVTVIDRAIAGALAQGKQDFLEPFHERRSLYASGRAFVSR